MKTDNLDPTDIARAQRMFAALYASHAERTRGRTRTRYLELANECAARAEAAEALLTA